MSGYVMDYTIQGVEILRDLTKGVKTTLNLILMAVVLHTLKPLPTAMFTVIAAFIILLILRSEIMEQWHNLLVHGKQFNAFLSSLGTETLVSVGLRKTDEQKFTAATNCVIDHSLVIVHKLPDDCGHLDTKPHHIEDDYEMVDANPAEKEDDDDYEMVDLGDKKKEIPNGHLDLERILMTPETSPSSPITGPVSPTTNQRSFYQYRIPDLEELPGFMS